MDPCKHVVFIETIFVDEDDEVYGICHECKKVVKADDAYIVDDGRPTQAEMTGIVEK